MISSAAHPRWIWFPLIDPMFLWLIGSDLRKDPFDDQLHRSSKMATTAKIHLESIKIQ
jgi:hypothetical protein